MHIFSFVSFPEKTYLVKVEKGDQPRIRIPSDQRFGQHKKPPFYRLIGWIKEGEGKGQRSEVGGRKSEIRGQKAEVREG